MKISKKELKEIIQEVLCNMEESDLVTKNTSKGWEETKTEFEDLVSKLLNHIKEDNYDDAEDLIGKTFKTLERWKKRIQDGKDKTQGKGYVLDED